MANIKNFFLKIGMELHFTLKEQHRKTNSKFEFQKTTILDPQKSAFLVFKEKPPHKFFFRVSALIQL